MPGGAATIKPLCKSGRSEERRVGKECRSRGAREHKQGKEEKVNIRLRGADVGED